MTHAKNIFIDGQAGTTGLQISDRLATRDDLNLLRLDDDQRKSTSARREALNAADIAILCLPDDAAREAVAMVTNPNTCVIDASTAHRTADGWVYGFPEYDQRQREKLRSARRISNPGCYAIASVALLHPLISAGVLPREWPVSINAVSGYSGGGKALIAAFEASDQEQRVDSTLYDYALSLNHKHVPEIRRWSGLQNAPIFLPAVGHYYKGMLVHIPLPLWALPGNPDASVLHQAYCAHYDSEAFVSVADTHESARSERLDPEQLNGTNQLRIHILHNAQTQQAVVVAQLDNLGKGASGQVVQTINILLDTAENRGL